MYSITKQDSQESYGYKEIFVKTLADAADVPTTYLPGSEILVWEGPTVLKLVENPDGTREWLEPFE